MLSWSMKPVPSIRFEPVVADGVVARPPTKMATAEPEQPVLAAMDDEATVFDDRDENQQPSSLHSDNG